MYNLLACCYYSDMKKNIFSQFLVICSLGLLVVVMSSSLFACATQVKAEEIPADLSKAVLFQRAQDFINLNNYPAATVYLETLKVRFAEDSDASIEADYLLAQIEYKTGNLVLAKASFDALLKLFDGENGAKLPQKIKVLSKRLLVIIDAKLGSLVSTSTSTTTLAP